MLDEMLLDEMLPLEPGCGADGVSARFNLMQRDINPYLEEPKSNKSLCTWMSNSMPSGHFMFTHPKKVEAVKEKWDDEPTKVHKRRSWRSQRSSTTIAAGVSYDPRVPESPCVGVPVLIVKWHTH